MSRTKRELEAIENVISVLGGENVQNTPEVQRRTLPAVNPPLCELRPRGDCGAKKRVLMSDQSNTYGEPRKRSRPSTFVGDPAAPAPSLEAEACATLLMGLARTPPPSPPSLKPDRLSEYVSRLEAFSAGPDVLPRLLPFIGREKPDGWGWTPHLIQMALELGAARPSGFGLRGRSGVCSPVVGTTQIQLTMIAGL